MHDVGRHSGWLTDRYTWVVILSTSITAGFLNLVSATLTDHSEIHSDLLALFAFLSLNVVTAAIAQFVVWRIASTALLRVGLDRAALAFAIGVGFVAIAGILPLLGSTDPMGESQRDAFRAAILSNVLLAPLLAYLLASHASARVRELGASLALSAPLLAGLMLVLLWLRIYRIEGVASPTSLIGTALIGGALLATLGLSVALRHRIPALSFLVTLTLLVVAAPLVPAIARSRNPASASPPAAFNSPSVLLLTVDTLRADALDLADTSESRTPALASLAAESIVFEQARSAAPWTKAGFASLLTGLSPLAHQTTKPISRLPDEIQTLAETLREHGYRTAAIGRNSFLSENANLDQGFDEYMFFPSSPGASLGGRILGRLAPLRFGWSDPTSADLTDTALDWIRTHHERPFLLWLHYFDPHLPYAPDASLLPGSEPPGELGISFDDNEGIRNGHYVPNREEQAWIRVLYDAEVRDVDANAARVLDLLRELGLYDRMLVAFTSDHGEEFWEHGSFEHGHALYDEVIRVPLLFKLPGGGSRGRFSEAVSSVSLTATLLDLLGLLEGAGPFSAGSLTGYWKPGATPPAAVPPLSTGVLYYEEKISLIFDGLKYIRNEQTGREELFDLGRDPHERVSLSSSSPERIEEARALIEQQVEAAAQLRHALDLPDESVLKPDAEWMNDLRKLGYVQ